MLGSAQYMSSAAAATGVTTDACTHKSVKWTCTVAGTGRIGETHKTTCLLWCTHGNTRGLQQANAHSRTPTRQ